MNMSFAFGGVRANATKKDLSVPSLDSPVMHITGSGAIPIVLGEYIPGKVHRFIGQTIDHFQDTAETYMDKSLPPAGFTYICGLRTEHATITKPLDKEIAATYKRNKWEYSELLEHMREDCPFVITAGRGLYALTQTNELQVSSFYDTVFNKTYFYSPDLQKFIFPIDSLPELMRRIRINFQAKGSWDSQIIERVQTGTDPKTVVADVYQTNFAMHQLIYAITHWRELQDELQTYKGIPSPKTEIVTDPRQIANILRSVKRRRVAMDIETSGFDFMNDRIGDFSMALDSELGYYFPWESIVQNEDTLDAFHSCVKQAHIIGANFKFDTKFIRWDLEHRDPKKRDWGPLTMKIGDDVVQAGHVLNEMRMNGLKTLAWLYTPFGGYNRAVDEWMAAHPKVDNYLEIPDDIRTRYAGMDAAVTFEVSKQQLRQFETVVEVIDRRDREDGTLPEDQSMYRYYSEYMMGVVNAIADIEYTGIIIDTGVLDAERELIVTKLTELESTILHGLEEEAGKKLPPFSLGSADQLGTILESVGWPVIRRNEKGLFATDNASLEKWAYMGYEVASLIQDYRSWSVLLSTFIGDKSESSGWWQYVREHEDGYARMHASYSPMRTNTGRNACRAPNLQNVPAHGIRAKHAKRPLAPPEGAYTASIDFDAFQLKIAALQSKDPTLFRLYRENSSADIHSVTAHKIFGQRMFDLVEVDFTDEKGQVKTVLGDTVITVRRAGKTLSVAASNYEFVEGDVVEIS